MSTVEEFDRVRVAASRLATAVIGDKTEYAYSNNGYFRTDQALGATPTLYVDLNAYGINDRRKINRFLLTEVKYFFEMNGGALTYQLYLFEDDNADDIQNQSDVVFASAAGKTGATPYYHREGGKGGVGAITTVDRTLPAIVNLADHNKLYYQLDWSAAVGAASSVRGYLKIRGKLLK
jgi:hypothetical protein